MGIGILVIFIYLAGMLDDGQSSVCLADVLNYRSVPVVGAFD